MKRFLRSGPENIVQHPNHRFRTVSDNTTGVQIILVRLHSELRCHSIHIVLFGNNELEYQKIYNYMYSILTIQTSVGSINRYRNRDMSQSSYSIFQKQHN